MRKLILLIILLELLHNAQAQTHAGAEQYYYKDDRQTFTYVPIVYFETGKNWYLEGRYNYEADKTMSVYAGKTFEKKSTLSYAVSPAAGIVLGRFKGGSVGVNNEANYKKFFFSSQLQYTFSVQDKTESFVYSWSDISYPAFNNIYTGFSVQQTNLYKDKCRLEKGFFAKAVFDNWALPLYVFDPAGKDRYFVLGLSCNW